MINLKKKRKPTRKLLLSPGGKITLKNNSQFTKTSNGTISE